MNVVVFYRYSSLERDENFFLQFFFFFFHFLRSGPSISHQIKIWSTAEKEAEKARRKNLKKAAKRGQRGAGGEFGGEGGAGVGGAGLDWLQSVGFEDEYLKQVGYT